MRTIQISIGELIEAVYEELVEAYGDRELALVAAQAVGDDLMQRFTGTGRDVAGTSPQLADSARLFGA